MEPTAEVVRRPGQSAFRNAVLRAYEGRCAVTGCDFSGTLDAAHIGGYRGQHTDHVENALLLRTDIHALFDAKLLGIDSKTKKIRISPVLKTTVYRELEGKVVSVPADPKFHPNRESLDKHREAAGL
jgi:putative restriction endonuclease